MNSLFGNSEAQRSEAQNGEHMREVWGREKSTKSSHVKVVEYYMQMLLYCREKEVVTFEHRICKDISNSCYDRLCVEVPLVIF